MSYRFTLKEYKKIINLAFSNNYSIINFRDYNKNNLKTPNILLRHDIDLDLECALKMAKLENQLNVKSTYFILLYNNFYNPFSPQNLIKINYIKDLGHEIGLHWDSRDYLGSREIKSDIKLMEEKFDIKIISASRHEPLESPIVKTPKILKREAYRDYKNLKYISDSSMSWRKETPEDLINQNISFQLLVHPFWWASKGNSIDEKFSYFLEKSKKLNEAIVRNYLRKTNMFLINREKKDLKFESAIYS